MSVERKTRNKFLLASGVLVVFATVLLASLFAFRYNFMKGLLKSILLGPPPIIHYILPPGNITTFVKELVLYFLYLFYQYPMFGVILGGIGILQFIKNDKITALFLLLIIFLNGFFFMKTTLWQSYGGTKYTFYISDYTIFSIFLGYGSLSLFSQINRLSRRCKITLQNNKTRVLSSVLVILFGVLLTVSFYSFIPEIVSYADIDLVNARTLPYRDNNKFFLNPNKRCYYGDRKFGEEVLQLSEKDSVVFADFTIYTILRYLIVVENKRPDIKLISSQGIIIREWVDRIKHNDPNTHIYICDDNEQDTADYYNFEGLEEKYILKRCGSFFEIVPRNDAFLD